MVVAADFKARFVITGYREWRDALTVHKWIEHLRTQAVLLLGASDNTTIWGVGDCPSGPDAIATRALRERGLNVKVYDADWDRHGDAAGPIRNNLMLAEVKPHQVLAFLDPKSKGAWGCAKKARPNSGVFWITGPKHHIHTKAGDPLPEIDWSKLRATV